MAKTPKIKAKTKHVKKGTKPWNSKNADGKRLIKLVKNGTIAPGTAPRLVREAHPEFQKYITSAFNAALRRIRKKTGAYVRQFAGKCKAIGHCACLLPGCDTMSYKTVLS